MTATTFSRRNDFGSHACTTYYWENLVLVVVLILESKAVYVVTEENSGLSTGHQPFFTHQCHLPKKVAKAWNWW